MIHESYYWKKDLINSSVWMVRNKQKFCNSEILSVRLEKYVLIGFYSIRKLIEAKKIATKLETHKVNIVYYPNTKKTDFFNWHKLEELFDFSVQQHENIMLVKLANYFIHSYIFMQSIDEEGQLNGFFISSDRTRNKKLYYVSLEQVRNIFLIVGTSDPSRLESRRLENGDWEVYSE